MREIFQKFKIDKTQKDDFDLYIPCGYNKVEYELTTINPKEKQKIYGISGRDRIVSKNSLWTIIFNK